MAALVNGSQDALSHTTSQLDGSFLLDLPEGQYVSVVVTIARAHFQRVELDDKRRGGLLTMPAVMTVTANGVETNPILRGVYVLENLLGTPPPPPPPDVEPLSPDLRGATTITESRVI